jgi:hypothetical protein
MVVAARKTMFTYIREENAMQQMIINIIEIRLTEGEKKRRYQI